jgi:membrane protease YdiL (CAAX protease family)
MTEWNQPDVDQEEAPEYEPLISRREIIAVWMATFLLMMIMGQIIGQVIGSVDRKEILILEIMVLAPALFVVWKKQLNPFVIFRLYPVPRAALGYSALLGLSVVVLLSEVDNLIRLVLPYPEGMEALDEAMQNTVTAGSGYELFVLVVTIAVIGGVVEEMLFRGFIQGALEEHLDVTRAIVAAAGMFAVMHFWPWIFLQITIIGILMGVLAWKSGSVFPAMVVHILNNAVSVLMSNAPESVGDPTEWQGHVNPLLLILAGVGFWYGIKMFYQLFETDDESDDPPEIESCADPS